MTLKQYLAEVRERREENWQDTICHEDIPRLIAIVEAQAEALEFINGGCLVPPDGGQPGLQDAISTASLALAKAEVIAKGEG